jgi:hypothetical protein
VVKVPANDRDKRQAFGLLEARHAPRGENPETFAASQSERQKQERLVLYDPGDPATGVLLDDLPGRLSVGLGGVLEAGSLRPIWTLLLALLALVGTPASVLVVA